MNALRVTYLYYALRTKLKQKCKLQILYMGVRYWFGDCLGREISCFAKLQEMAYNHTGMCYPNTEFLGQTFLVWSVWETQERSTWTEERANKQIVVECLNTRIRYVETFELSSS
jgi:hypothetical protein